MNSPKGAFSTAPFSLFGTKLILLIAIFSIALNATAAKAPFVKGFYAAVSSFAPSSGSPGTLIKIKGSGLAGATNVTIGNTAALIISTVDSTLTAMVMPGNVTGAVRVTTAGGAVLAAQGTFTVTATAHPTAQIGPKMADTTTYPNAGYLAGEGPVNGQIPPMAYRYKNVEQGNVVSLSADGNTAITASQLGLNYDYQSLFSPGGLTFYEKRNGAWAKSGQYFLNSGIGLQWADSIAINANGTVALIISRYLGRAIFLFEKQNGVWKKSSQEFYGITGAISADGNTVVTGYSRVSGNRHPTIDEFVVVYHRVNGAWIKDAPAGAPWTGNPNNTPEGTVDFGDGKTAGSKLSLSADGKTMAVATASGGVYIMKYNGAKWLVQKYLTGASVHVALSADGNILLQQVIDGNTGAHYAATYTRKDTTWAKGQLLNEGGKLSMTADGNVIMFSNYAGPIIYVRNSAGTWVKQSSSFSPTPAYSVSISADGTNALAGFPYDTSIGQVRSKIYVNTTVWDPQSNLSVTKVDTIYRMDSYGSVTAYNTEPPVVTPGGYATLLNFTNTTATSTTLNWTNGPGGKRAVFLHVNAGSAPIPSDFTTYAANAAFSKGAQLGTTGWYCVYNGAGNTVNISNLTGGTKYYAVVIEYNGAPGLEKYYTARMAPAYVVTPVVAPTVQASNLAFSNIAGTTSTVSWTNGSGTGRAVFINKTNSGAPLPANVYYSSNVRFGSGNQIGSTGWYCIYNGTGSTTNVIGLISGGTYRVAVVEYNGTIDKPLYLTNNIAPANVTTPITPPTAYTYGLTFSNTTFNSTKATWVSGNGTARSVFVRAGGKSQINPTTGVTYSANSTFGLGSQEGASGWYCVYNGTANTTNIFGLSASSTYTVLVVEYNGTAGSEAYLKTGYNPASVTTTANNLRIASNGYNTTNLAPGLNNTGNNAVVANNILSPNGDGKNDTWIVSNIESYPENTVNVTDGGGNVVFSKKGYANDWAGTYRGGVLSEGTYYYTIDLGKSNLIKGFFTVVRDR